MSYSIRRAKREKSAKCCLRARRIARAMAAIKAIHAAMRLDSFIVSVTAARHNSHFPRPSPDGVRNVFVMADTDAEADRQVCDLIAQLRAQGIKVSTP